MKLNQKKSILQTNPKSSYLAYKYEIDEAIRRVLDSGLYILGSEVELFEQEFANYIGVNHGIGVANGTDALEIALRGCGVGKGDVVLTVSHTAVATVAAIELVGAIPFLVDVNSDDFTIDVDCLIKTIEYVKKNPSIGSLKAIIPVHLYGHPASMATIMELAKQHDLYVIEDCAQAHGATLNSRRIGTWGHCAAFSLYPTKNLGAIGDAGIVITQDSTLENRFKSLRQYGWETRYISSLPGMNSRLDVLQAAILRVKLKYLDADNKKRQTIAQAYINGLQNLPLKLPKAASEVSHVYHQFVLRVERRDELFNFLISRGIGVALHYPMPVHLQPAYSSRIPFIPKSLPITEQLQTDILSLPMHPFLGMDEVQDVISEIKNWYDAS